MFSKKKKKIVKIEGMSCSHCAKKVEDNLNSIEGVNKTRVNLSNNTATIIIYRNIDNDIIKSKIENLDYKVISIEDN